MKAQVQPQDMPKVIGLVVALVIVLGYILVTLSRGLSGAEATQPSPSAVDTAPSVQVASRAAPNDDPMAYIQTIERFSAPPAPPVGGDPFRSVMPRAVSAGSRPTSSRPPTGISEIDLRPFQPGGEGVQVGDFPEVKVLGVMVDFSSGDEATYAVLEVGGRTMYLQPGDKLQEDLKITRVTEAGVWLLAGKERAFVEVSRSYRPSGIPRA